MNGKAAAETRLKAVVHSWLAPVPPQTEAELARLIGNAVRRMDHDGTLSDPAKLLLAETNLRRLLTEMTREAGALGVQRLEGKTLEKALETLCPMWPFCE